MAYLAHGWRLALLCCTIAETRRTLHTIGNVKSDVVHSRDVSVPLESSEQHLARDDFTIDHEIVDASEAMASLAAGTSEHDVAVQHLLDDQVANMTRRPLTELARADDRPKVSSVMQSASDAHSLLGLAQTSVRSLHSTTKLLPSNLAMICLLTLCILVICSAAFYILERMLSWSGCFGSKTSNAAESARTKLNALKAMTPKESLKPGDIRWCGRTKSMRDESRAKENKTLVEALFAKRKAFFACKLHSLDSGEDADPKEESSWLREEMWIDTTGALHKYRVKAQRVDVLFNGVTVGCLEVANVSAGETCRKFCLKLQLAAADTPQAATSTMLALDDAAAVESFETALEHFRLVENAKREAVFLCQVTELDDDDEAVSSSDCWLDVDGQLKYYNAKEREIQDMFDGTSAADLEIEPCPWGSDHPHCVRITLDLPEAAEGNTGAGLHMSEGLGGGSLFALADKDTQVGFCEACAQFKAQQLKPDVPKLALQSPSGFGFKPDCMAM